jgi:SAM-dependent methyltransferase
MNHRNLVQFRKDLCISRILILHGNVIDIGGGTDPVVANAEVFDLEHGDAQNILKYKEKESYDCVYSSHCLEHMKDVPSALSEWWSLVKPGGYLVTVVPHEDLYEQKIWPSIFNNDHKATFRLKSEKTWSPCSYDIYSLNVNLPNAKYISAEIQDSNYDYFLQGKKLGKFSRKIYKWKRSKNLFKKNISNLLYNFLHRNLWVNTDNNSNGIPVDQTLGNALAQIQTVFQKTKIN